MAKQPRDEADHNRRRSPESKARRLADNRARYWARKAADPLVCSRTYFARAGKDRFGLLLSERRGVGSATGPRTAEHLFAQLRFVRRELPSEAFARALFSVGVEAHEAWLDSLDEVVCE